MMAMTTSSSIKVNAANLEFRGHGFIIIFFQNRLKNATQTGVRIPNGSDRMLSLNHRLVKSQPDFFQTRPLKLVVPKFDGARLVSSRSALDGKRRVMLF